MQKMVQEEDEDEADSHANQRRGYGKRRLRYNEERGDGENTYNPATQQGHIRKVLIVMRHGDTPVDKSGSSLDAILDKSVQSLHREFANTLEGHVRQYGVTPDRTFVQHTDKKRTKTTARAALSGAFREHFNRKMPRNEAELHDKRAYDFGAVEEIEDPRLAYHDQMIHKKVYADKNLGVPAVMQHWLDNPDANTHEHKGEVAQIEPFVNVERRTRSALRDSLITLLSGKKDLGVIATHSTLVDTIMASIIESGGQSIRSIKDIGGEVKKEGYGALVIDIIPGRTPQDTRYQAVFVRNGKQYAVDLGNLLNESYTPSFLDRDSDKANHRQANMRYHSPTSPRSLNRGYTSSRDRLENYQGVRDEGEEDEREESGARESNRARYNQDRGRHNQGRYANAGRGRYQRREHEKAEK